MTLGEIVFVIVLVSAFIMMIYKIIKLDPKRKPRVWPVYQRILVIVACVGALAVAWIIAPESTWSTKVLLTVFPILYIYRALNGWAFKSKVSTSITSSQSPD